jgi:hypothetical protein
MYCSWVFPFHICLLLQEMPASNYLLRQRKNLKESAVECQEILVYKVISGQDISININGELRAYFIVGVERQTIPVCHQDKEEIQQQFFMAKAGPEAMPEETMLNKGETAINLSDSVADKWISHKSTSVM